MKTMLVFLLNETVVFSMASPVINVAVLLIHLLEFFYIAIYHTSTYKLLCSFSLLISYIVL